MSTETILYIAIATIIIMLASIAGVIFLQKNFHKWLDKNLPILVSFSAGVFIFIAIHLAKESFEIFNGSNFIPIISLASGVLVFLMLKVLWPECHHHEYECHEHEHNKPRAIRMMMGDSVHNLADGFIIVSAFIVSVKLGIITAISIFIHEFLQEISEFFVLKDSGYSTKQALILNFLVSTTIIIGVIAGLFLAQDKTTLGVLLGFASGSFLYIVIVDLFPYSKMRQNFSTAIKHTASFIIGILFVALLNILLGH